MQYFSKNLYMVIVGLSFVFTQPWRYGYDFKMSFKPFQTCLHKNFIKIRIRKMLIWLISMVNRLELPVSKFSANWRRFANIQDAVYRAAWSLRNVGASTDLRTSSPSRVRTKSNVWPFVWVASWTCWTRSNVFRISANRSSGLNIGTWNVRTLQTDGNWEILLEEASKFRIDIPGLCETHMIGNETLLSKDEYTILLSNRADGMRREGVDIMISQHMTHCLESYDTVSSRLMTAKFNIQWRR